MTPREMAEYLTSPITDESALEVELALERSIVGF
jgi:hypothetical protein